MTDLAEPIGEAWMTGGESRFANGPFAGQRLIDAWPAMPPEWTGASARAESLSADFPLLVKFIFAEEKLSVQVHPGDEYAAEQEAAAGGRGKTEMWYAVRARPGAEVLVGLKPRVTRKSFERAIAEAAAEECLKHVSMRTGDAIFVPAGTAHTIGPGLVLCEIQQHSDLTYRVYDYNRRDAEGRTRPLHIEKALAVMRFGKQEGGKIKPVRIERGGLKRTYLAACRYFATEKWEFSSLVPAESGRGRFELLIFIEGHGTIRWGSDPVEYGPAQVWLIPAALDGCDLVPELRTSMLRTYVPDDMKEISRELAEQGIEEAARARLLHL